MAERVPVAAGRSHAGSRASRGRPLLARLRRAQHGVTGVAAQPARADVALAVVLCGLGVIELVGTGQRAASVVTVLVMTVPVVLVRRAPLASAAVMCSWWLVDLAVGGRFDRPFWVLLAFMYVVYRLAAHAPARRAAAGIALLLASLDVDVLLAGGGYADHGFYAELLGLPALIGVAARRHRERSRLLAILGARLEREREASERLAVVEERRRIAHELHDAIAHAVGRMVLQAAGAEQILAAAPERARAALSAVQDTGRDAIAELRQALGVLDMGEEPAAAAVPDAQSPSAMRAFWGPRWLDVPLAAAIVATVDGAVLADASALELAGVIAAGVAIAVRRRAALVALGLAVGVQDVLIATVPSDRLGSTFVAVMVAVYTLAVYAPGRRALGAAVLAAGALAGVLVATDAAIKIPPSLLLMAAAGAAGLPVRAARRQADRLDRLAARLARERDARARLAKLGERARLARELHDSVAHAVSVMVLQAGAAEAVLDAQPDRAREAARAVEAHGREAVRELRALLGMLAGDAQPGSRAPQPSLSRLDDLVARVRDAGLPVELRISGRPVPLPAGVDMSAYRIIQEALTNTLKHAGRVPTVVTLHYGIDALDVEIADRGSGASPARAHTGHGMIGMRERVALHGGVLSAQARPGAGYVVRAELPVGPVSE